MLEISKKARISPLADIEDSTRGSRIVIGDDTMIDSFVKIKPAGGSGDLEIGERCAINSGVVIYTGNGVRIGNNVAIAANTTIAAANHEFRDPARSFREQGFMPSRGGVIIEDDVWIGANAVLLDGAILRKGCIIGAGSIVGCEVPENSINYGQPAKSVGFRGKGKFALPDS